MPGTDGKYYFSYSVLGKCPIDSSEVEMAIVSDSEKSRNII
jgi:hypothetical protein